MATFVPVKGTEFEAGRLRGRLYDVTFSNSYAAGGEVISAEDAGLSSIMGMHVLGGNAAAGALLFHLDHANSKIMVLYPSGGGTAAGAALADPAITAGAVAVTSSVANGAAALTAGRGREVTATTNLTSVTIRAMFFGF